MASDPLDPEAIARAALHYLERFDSSSANLKRVLMRRLRRKSRDTPVDFDRAAEIIDALLERYQASSLLDDKRYARALATSLRARGSSRRAIIAKLRVRGVADALAQAAVEAVDTDNDTADAELAAAIALVRKRRMGPHRPEHEREAEQRRDLSRLARAGFSFDVARRALRADEVDDAF